MTARLLLVGLDGADGRLLDAWSRSGALANLAALRARGTFVRLSNTTDISDDAMWASFQYGVGVAEHGRHHYLVSGKPGEFTMAVSDENADDTFWSRLSTAGLKVAVLDVPKCPAPKPLNGIHLADWLVHGRYAAGPVSYPETLALEVVEKFGPAPPSRCGYLQAQLDDAEIMAFADALGASVAQKSAAGLHYLMQADWDLFVIGFKEGHCAGHGLWHMVDERHADYDPARRARLGDPIARVFAVLDRAVGDLVAGAGADVEVVVFSTSEMEPNGSLLHLHDGIAARIEAVLAQRHDGMLLRAAGRLLPHRGKRSSRYLRAIPANENIAAFRVTCQRGLFQAVLRDAEELLLELVDPATGLPAFIGAARPSTEWRGARAGSLPDLLAFCRSNAFPEAVVSSRLGRVAAPFSRMRPGNHVGGGVAIAAGRKLTRLGGELRTLADFAGLSRTVLGASAVGVRG